MTEQQFLEAAMRMRTKLYHVAMTILWDEQDAADAVQEAMLKGWRHRGGLRDEAVFEAWFMRIAVNQCRDFQRRQIRRRRTLEALNRQRPPAAEEPPDVALFEAIHDLPEQLRLPVLLYYFEGYSQKEIGAIVGATSEQVKTRIRQARVKLKAALGEETTGKGGRRNERS